MAEKARSENELSAARERKLTAGSAPLGSMPSVSTDVSLTMSTRPKNLGSIVNTVVGKFSHQNAEDIPTIDVNMNWQGRYKPLDKNSPALMPTHAVDTGHSEMPIPKILIKHPQSGLSNSSTSQNERNAMVALFGEAITPRHVHIYATLKKLVPKWRTRAAQRKNLVAVEKFANDEIQKRAILKHKEQAIVNLPMPITWALKQEVLAVLLDVVKVYNKEFGNNHKLTMDAKKRIDKIQSDLSRPRDL